MVERLRRVRANGATRLFRRRGDRGQRIQFNTTAVFRGVGNPPRGSLWHAFRRKWATEQKHYPIVDVAVAGGWKDLTTLLTCYQQPDHATMRAVMERAPILSQRSHELPHLNK